MTRPLNRIMDNLNGGNEKVASTSNQVSFNSQSLSEGASEQAASLAETSSTLEEMSSMINSNAESANQAKALVNESNLVTAQASESMSKLRGAMEEISTASEETSRIIKTIDEIAFQTNLLALNAAVEAARAGEVGADFAVVADEVRNLAMRAAEAARDTAGLIEGTARKLKDGSGLVLNTNEIFDRMAESSTKVAELAGELPRTPMNSPGSSSRSIKP